MLRPELIGQRGQQNGDGRNREMDAGGEREIELVIMLDDALPKISVPRAAVFASEQAQLNVAQFVQGAFGSGKQDQHHDADAGQEYFGFHICLKSVRVRERVSID